jgi:transcriptional regulator with XRE-family HTH domain
MILQRYFDTYATLNDAKLASLLGVSRIAVIRWRRGNRRPSLEVMFEIQRLTEGKVRVSDWLKQQGREA